MSRNVLPHGLGERARKTAGIAGTLALAGARRLVRHRETDDAELGRALLGELDSMKGMAMKVGQILSYMDGALPSETQVALQSLQRGVEPLSFDAIEAVIQDALGSPADTVLQDFDRQAIAAASIGQVHRARVGEQAVAVKVQYPHVVQTFDSDLRNLRRIARVASAATRVDGVAIVEDIQQRLHEECDYRFEARWLTRFASALQGIDGAHFPKVLPHLSAQTVLTTTWCEGADFYRFAETAPVEVRRRAGLILVQVALTSLYTLGCINADPHPGNYLFQPDGDVVFLDFGCVRQLSLSWQQTDRDIVRALLDDDRAAFRQAVVRSGIIAGPVQAFDFDLHWQMLSWQWAPFLAPRFHFTPDWMAEGVPYSRPSNPNLRRMAITGEWVWVERLRWGLCSVLTKLDVDLELRDLLEQVLATPTTPLRDAA